jgi:Fe-coproporphyrin III synthase
VRAARLLRFGRSVLLNRTGGVPRPSWVTWLVTFRCNARCTMCDSWRLKPGPELTPAQARAVFGKLGPLDVVRLSGGEPFLREDLPELARAVLEASRPLVLHVTTNGSFPDRVEAFVRGFSRPSRLQLLVSFDGLAEAHDRNRGPQVPFAAALETARRARALGVRVTANHTLVGARSLADHQGLREALGKHGVPVQAVVAYADSAMYTLALRGKKAEHLLLPRGYPLHPALQGSDVVGFAQRQLEEAGQAPMPERLGKRYLWRGLLDRLGGRVEPRPHPRCVALRSHLRLLPDGRVPVCQFNTETVGSLLDQSLDEVWRGAAAASRAWVDACPGCWAECEVIPSAIYTADPALLR